jgi:hypothetical protein
MKKTRIAAELIRKGVFRVLEESGYNLLISLVEPRGIEPLTS